MNNKEIKDRKPFLVIVTGLSGAGKSIFIKALEDMSFYCIDNLPVELAIPTVDFLVSNVKSGLYALGMDVRNPEFIAQLSNIKLALSSRLQLELVFLRAEEDILVQRFSATRRPHPLMNSDDGLVPAIRREAAFLEDVEQEASTVFDTTEWSPHYLSRQVEKRFSQLNVSRNLNVNIVSFGFKYGLLNPADSVYDVRFLKNPHYQPSLRMKTGLQKDVASFIQTDSKTAELMKHLIMINEFLIPEYYREGKNYLRIGIGCTGGKHRSVYVAETLGRLLMQKKIPHTKISVDHRDIDNTDLVKR